MNAGTTAVLWARAKLSFPSSQVELRHQRGVVGARLVVGHGRLVGQPLVVGRDRVAARRQRRRAEDMVEHAAAPAVQHGETAVRSEMNTTAHQSLMRKSYA